MSERVEVYPVTRIEGHARITVIFEDGRPEDVRFQVLEFRGFEKFLEGRPIEDAPIITPRICGICQVAHHLASVKACDAVFGVEPPEPAVKLRNLMHQAANVHSHALHLYFLAAPDLVYPDEEDPAARHVFRIARERPEVVKAAVALRRFGQRVVEVVGRRPINPVTGVPGGVSRSLSEEERDELLAEAREVLETAETTVDFALELTERIEEEGLLGLGALETYHMGLVDGGTHELYDGTLRAVDPEGNVAVEFDPSDYVDHVAELVRPHSYLKFPYLRDVGYPEGIYRVNALSRLNVCDGMPTERAQARLEEFEERFGLPRHEPMLYHLARAIEILCSVELCIELLEDDDVVSDEVREEVSVEDAAGSEGVGCVEAPRGVLIHHFETDEDGLIEAANLVVATVQNNPAMEEGVRRVVEEHVESPEDLDDLLLNRLEMVIRAYDPCLSCASHAVGVGRYPLVVEAVTRDGEVLARVGPK